MATPHGGRRGRGRVAEKPKNMREVLKKLVRYCRREAAPFVVAIILAVAGAVLVIVGPNQISRITDYMFNGIAGGISTTDIQKDLMRQLQSGELSLDELAQYLPEGTDLSSLQGSELLDSDSEQVLRLLEHISLSDEFIAEHEGDGIDLAGIFSVALVLLAIYMGSSLCSFTQSWIMAGITQRVSYRMRGDLDRKVNRLPLKYFSGNTYGDVLSRATNDVDTISQGISSSAAQLVSAATQFVGCLLMMFVTSVPMALATVLTSLLGIVFMGQIMRRSQPYFKARQDNLGAVNGYVEEMYSGHDVIRVYGAKDKVGEKFSELNANLREADVKSQFISGLMMPLMTFVGNLGYVAVCIVGAALCINGSITFGVITAFLIYVRLFEQPLRQIGQGMTNIQSAAAAAERVFALLEEEELEDEAGKQASLEGIRGEVEFSHVSFAYPDEPEKEIIHDFSVHVLPGQKVAIVGPTGAGKTTLVNLLMRFFEPTGGSITIDGVDTRDLTREAVHDQFGMVLQDTWLFEGTVRENLGFGRDDVTDAELDAATSACGIHQFIMALPEGYDTVIGEETAISAGQRQLFTIARAMIQDNPMLILDEATSSVDTRTELLTQQAMDKLSERRTSFVIAHRLSTIRNADVILVMREGDIVEQGTHEGLLAEGGFYAELYMSQFEQVG